MQHGHSQIGPSNYEAPSLIYDENGQILDQPFFYTQLNQLLSTSLTNQLYLYTARTL